MERHSLDDGRDTTRPENPNIFDDEYAVDDDEDDYGLGVADGFRPGPSLPASHHTRENPPPTQAAPQSTMTGTSTSGRNSRQAVSRNSTVKEHGMRNTLTVTGEGASATRPGRTLSTYSGDSQVSAPLNRSTSFASSFAPTDRSQSPFQSTGPSHPYTLYPQGTGVACSVSVATSSTTPASQRRLSEQQGPSHPYTLYPQNVFADPPDDEVIQVQPAIPVGFPGNSHGYHRRIGPDGEEQDIIGPDGHTEQLPPYTRFPEEGVSKVLLAADSNESHEALYPSGHVPLQQVSIVPANVGAERRVAPGSRASGFSEKTWNEKSWKEKRKTRFLGGKVPLWVLLLMAVVIIAIAAGMGAGIGAVVSHRSAAKEAQSSATTVTITASMFDASPIPTPAQPLPTGTWALPLKITEEPQDSCLVDRSQATAWSCDYRYPPLRFSINDLAGTDVQGACLEPMNSSLSPIYGVQPPQISFQELEFVSDFDAPAKGPAWHFSARYNKTVIVAEDDFAAAQQRSRRSAPSAFSLAPNWGWRKQVQAGERPWFCVWNDTFIEGFIYINQGSLASSASPSSTSRSPVPSTPLSSTLSLEGVQQTPSPARTTYSTTIAPGATTIDVTISTNAPLNGAFSVAFPSSVLVEPQQTHGPNSYPWYSHSYGQRAAAAPSNAAFPPYLQEFPAAVKIEERRLPGSQPPYCQQMQVLDNGGWNPVVDGNNQWIKVYLNEQDPGVDEWVGRYPVPTGVKGKRRDPAGACHCQWWSCD